MRAQEPQGKATPLPGSDPVAQLSRLTRNKSYSFTLEPDSEAIAALRDDLGLLGLRKLRLTGQITPLDGADWELTARLGATVVQPCTATLAPVTTRLDEDILRRYVAEWSSPEAGSETEMSEEDDTREPLPKTLDLRDLLQEALSLSLPLYPRAKDADFDGLQAAAPGVVPLQDEDTKPFAGLAALRDQLSSNDDGDRD